MKSTHSHRRWRAFTILATEEPHPFWNSKLKKLTFKPDFVDLPVNNFPNFSKAAALAQAPMHTLVSTVVYMAQHCGLANENLKSRGFDSHLLQPKQPNELFPRANSAFYPQQYNTMQHKFT